MCFDPCVNMTKLLLGSNDAFTCKRVLSAFSGGKDSRGTLVSGRMRLQVSPISGVKSWIEFQLLLNRLKPAALN